MKKLIIIVALIGTFSQVKSICYEAVEDGDRGVRISDVMIENGKGHMSLGFLKESQNHYTTTLSYCTNKEQLKKINTHLANVDELIELLEG